MECVKELLKADNIMVNVQNKLGDSALHNAAWKGQSEIVAMLLEKGASLSAAVSLSLFSFSGPTRPLQTLFPSQVLTAR